MTPGLAGTTLRTVVLRLSLCAVLLPLGSLPPPLLAQGSTCRQVLAATAVQTGSYGVVDAAPFEGRVFVYVPPGDGAMQVWVVEGVYGRPFVRASGPLSPAAFARLRTNRNIRATRVIVSRGDGSEGAVVRVGKDAYRLVVAGASRSGVQVRACGP